MMTLQQVTSLQALLTVAHHDHEKGLNMRALFKVHDRAIGEDLVQDTFMKTWVYLAKGGKIDVMKSFLYHVLNNLIVDQYRKHKTSSLDVMLEQGFEPSAGDAEPMTNGIDAKAALLFLERLTPKYQKVMRLRYQQNLSIKEIALLTGQSANAVAVQLHRGLAKLKLLYHHN